MILFSLSLNFRYLFFSLLNLHKIYFYFFAFSCFNILIHFSIKKEQIVGLIDRSMSQKNQLTVNFLFSVNLQFTEEGFVTIFEYVVYSNIHFALEFV